VSDGLDDLVSRPSRWRCGTGPVRTGFWSRPTRELLYSFLHTWQAVSSLKCDRSTCVPTAAWGLSSDSLPPSCSIRHPMGALPRLVFRQGQTRPHLEWFAS